MNVKDKLLYLGLSLGFIVYLLIRTKSQQNLIKKI